MKWIILPMTINISIYSTCSSWDNPLNVCDKELLMIAGESGVGKSAILKHLLQRLEKDGGTGYKSDTVLGSVFNFTDKNQALLSNISSLTKMGGEDGEWWIFDKELCHYILFINV